MKVSELIAKLQIILDDGGDVHIISSVDDEGNGYRFCGGLDLVFVEDGHYHIENVYDSVEEAVEDYDADEGRLMQVALIY